MVDIAMEVDTKEIERKLKQLPKKVGRSVILKSARAGARVITKEQKATAPTESGTLKKSIALKTKPAGKSAKFVHTVSIIIRPAAWYWFFVEFGTSKQSANPFLRAAFDAKKKQAAETHKKKLLELINQAVK